MKTNTLIILFLTSFSLFGGDTYQLLPPQRGDFSPSILTTKTITTRSMNENHELVNFTSLLDQTQKHNFDHAPATAHSKSYSIDVQSRAIEIGIQVHTTAPGALIRLQALVEKGESLDLDNSYAMLPQNILLVDSNERMYRGDEAFISFINQDQLDEAGISPEGTVAFQINPKLGTGTFTLHLDQYHASAALRVQVQENDSPYSLNIQMASDISFDGSLITVYADLSSAQSAELLTSRVNELRAEMLSPSGRSYSMRFSQKEGQFTASAQLPEETRFETGLWEVSLTIDSSNHEYRIRRDARTAFSLIMPTARLTGQVDVNQATKKNPSLSLSFEVETAQPGRFEVRGYLYGTNEKGALLPLAMLNAANYLDEKEWIEVSISNQILEKSELGAPYVLKGLSLRDQSHMQVLSLLKKALVLK